MLYAIINMGQTICRIKILPMIAGGEKGETFLQTKISSYTTLWGLQPLGTTQTENSQRLGLDCAVSTGLVSITGRSGSAVKKCIAIW